MHKSLVPRSARRDAALRLGRYLFDNQCLALPQEWSTENPADHKRSYVDKVAGGGGFDSRASSPERPQHAMPQVVATLIHLIQLGRGAVGRRSKHASSQCERSVFASQQIRLVRPLIGERCVAELKLVAPTF